MGEGVGVGELTDTDTLGESLIGDFLGQPPNKSGNVTTMQADLKERALHTARRSLLVWLSFISQLENHWAGFDLSSALAARARDTIESKARLPNAKGFCRAVSHASDIVIASNLSNAAIF